MTSLEQRAKNFIEKSTTIHGGKYDYSLVEYNGSSKKVKIICPKHGVFEQSANDHANGCGCQECGKEKTLQARTGNNEKFVKKAIAAHGDRYDYSKAIYKGANEPVEIICKKHGVFWQKPVNHVQGFGCRKCSDEANSSRLTLDKDFVIKQFKSVHGSKYDYSLIEYKGHEEKVKIICCEHGIFEQTPHEHKGGCGCPKCGTEKKRTSLADDKDDFVKKSTITHGDRYDYSEVEYKKSGESVKIICKNHGPFLQRPYAHIQGAGCPACAPQTSKHEDAIADFISSLGHIVERGRRDLIGNRKEVDIYIPKKKIGVEFDGLRWHSEGMGKDNLYHLEKTALLSKNGVRLIHVIEDEMVYKKDIVFARLKSMLVNLPKIHARKCEIREIDAKIKNEFLERTHIQGADRAAVSLGAYHGDELVAVMTFCKARVALGHKGEKAEGKVELSRFSTVPDFRVVGIAGKLLAFYERKYQPQEIISYADKRWSEGGLYEALGFEKIHESKPNYWYFKLSEKQLARRIHRFNFARHRLEKHFSKTFPKEMTEWEIMQSEGYDRIWDCGNILFSKKYNK